MAKKRLTEDEASGFGDSQIMPEATRIAIRNARLNACISRTAEKFVANYADEYNDNDYFNEVK